MGPSLLAKLTVTQVRAGEIGEPSRKWYIVPRVVPVPPPLEPHDLPDPVPGAIPEREPERVPA